MATEERYRYSRDQLTLILDQTGFYMCACPAQVATQMLALRNLYQYQLNCMSEMPDLAATHRCIAKAVLRAHSVLEEALDEVLRIEGWDPSSLAMPEGLRKLRNQQL